jgi:hypothetical protein
MAVPVAEYKLLPTTNQDDIVNESPPQARQTKTYRSILARILVVFSIMYLASSGVHSISRIGGRWGAWCGSGAGHRALSTSRGVQLPTHYTLPSGDKIPSVALGKA